MLHASRAARGDDADLHRARDFAQQLEIEAVAGAVAIDGGEEDLARAERFRGLAPLDGVDGGRFLSAADRGEAAFRIARENDGLHAELARAFANELGTAQRGRVDG